MNLRARARAALPARAFLRRDRGEALFVTDAPRHGWTGEVPGFCMTESGGLARLYIKEETMRECAFSSDKMAQSLVRFQDAPADREVIALFAEGIKILEAPSEKGYLLYDKKVRQAAAVALRTGNGGGLYACALVLAEIKRRIEK